MKRIRFDLPNLRLPRSGNPESISAASRSVTSISLTLDGIEDMARLKQAQFDPSTPCQPSPPNSNGQADSGGDLIRSFKDVVTEFACAVIGDDPNETTSAES